MSGILYGVSVGPGDPELMTLKAVKIINSCDTIAIPRTDNSHTLAFDIAKQACKIEGKEILYFDFLMSRDKKSLKERHDAIAQQLYPHLQKGNNIAFLCLGDISVYSTFSYISERVCNAGFKVDICPGVTSFCAIASEVKRPLVQGNESLIIMPASCSEFDELIKHNGTKVIMKTGKKLPYVKERLSEDHQLGNSYAVCSCGLNEQKIYEDLENIPDECGYFTTIISEGNAHD